VLGRGPLSSCSTKAFIPVSTVGEPGAVMTCMGNGVAGEPSKGGGAAAWAVGPATATAVTMIPPSAPTAMTATAAAMNGFAAPRR